jgi:hypothetical protein
MFMQHLHFLRATTNIINQSHFQIKLQRLLLNELLHHTKKYSKKCGAEPEWLSGLKNSDSIKIYTSLFNLLFDEDEPRSEEGILYTLVKKRIKSEWDFDYS